MTFNIISIARICSVLGLWALVGSTNAFASQTTRADAGMAALQSLYNSSTGLFQTPAGWWQDANALETTVDYMARTGNTLYAQDISTTFNNNQSNNFLDAYYDDEGWWATAWIKAYDFTGNVQYINAAKTIFTDMSAAWDPNTCGGGIWWDKAHTYKNAIANELFLSVAARLHNRTPGDGGPGSYLDWAQKEWQWFAATGMINSSALINDGLTSGCQNNGETTWSYNQGVILGGLVDLYKATNNRTLLTEAETLASASTTTPALVNANGILVESCEATGCGNDGAEFKGPYVKNLYYLYTTDKLAKWQQFLTTNADSLWKNDRNSNNDFGLHWAGPFDTADGARQTIGVDLLNSTVPYATYYPDTVSAGASFGVIAQTAGTFKLTFNYDALGATATRNVLINGVPVSNAMSFSGSSASLDVALVQGQSTVTVQKAAGSSGGGPTLTSLDVAPAGASFTLYEAEDAASNVGTESTNAGYTGSGYRCCWNSDGQYVTFTVNIAHPGNVQLIYHYAAAAGNAAREVLVNGIPVETVLAFPNTNEWTDWSFVSINANLQQGDNSVTVYYDAGTGSNNYINLDNLQVLY